MANFNFYIKDEEVARILFIENASSQDEITKVQDAVDALLWACEEYLWYKYGSGGPYDSGEEYEANIEEKANELGEILGCDMKSSHPFVWYVDDVTILGYELPVVWNSSDDTLYAVEVQGNIIGDAKVTLWSWDIANGPWTKNAETTQKAYKAVCEEIKDETTGERYGNRDFSYNVWNDLCEKVKAVLDAVNENTGDPDYVWNDSYAAYDDTLMSEDSRYLSAARFNSLRFNIGKHESTGIEDVEDGQEVQMSYFTKIVNSLNALIVAKGLSEE